MSTLPKGIQFKTVKPQGFYQEFRDYTVTPVQTYSNQFSINDIVRIQFNIQDWYIDPYESYIEAEVRLNNETTVDYQTAVNMQTANPVQFIMMDGPSTSLINDFRLEVNSKEVERIREYDQIGNILTDLNIYPDVVDQNDYQGYFSNRGAVTYQGTQSGINTCNGIISSASATNYNVASNCYNSNVVPWCYAGNNTVNGEPFHNQSDTVNAFSIPANVTKFEDMIIGTLQQTSSTNYTGTINSNLNTPIQALNSQTDARIQPVTQPGRFYNYAQFMGSLTSANSNFGINHADYSVDSTSTNGSGFIPNVESPKLSQVDGHNIFLTNLPTAKIINGKFRGAVYNAPATTQCSRAYMQIPLLSGTMGVLIPQERWQLIPSSSLGQVNMEFRFNENAFFSHDGTPPNWIVTKFQLRLRMYRFDAALMSQLKNVVNGGIQLHSQSFSMGPRYTVQANVSPTNNWQLNNGIPSIKQLFFWFLSADYEQFNYCRKNFRLSQNITSMQLKIGSSYIPQNPIIGHAGNIVMNSVIQQDNSVYLSELHQAMNILFDSQRHININKVNFAINERPYDVTLAKMYNIQGANLTTLKSDLLKKAGYTLWNEMRCKGKALYAFNLEADKRNDDTMSGLDTTKLRPIELILKSDDSSQYPRNSTLFVAFLSDFVVTFTGNDVVTEGQG